MNINKINTYNNIQNHYTKHSSQITVKSPITSDCFCGNKTNKKEFDTAMEYIKSFFAKPIEIMPKVGSIFSKGYQDECASIDLIDSKLEDAVRYFYDYNIPSKERQEFCKLAEQILDINSGKKINTAIPGAEEISLQKKFNIMEKVLKEKGFTIDNKNYPVKFVWKFNPYSTLRQALDHNIGILKFNF